VGGSSPLIARTIDMDFYITQEVLALVPLTIGFVQVVKSAGLPEKYAPLVAMFVGVGFCLFVMNTLAAAVLGGIAVGLMASGLYSGVRTMAAR
jgi:hypothetical protein